MKKSSGNPKLNEVALSLSEFLETFNAHMPKHFPQATEKKLLKFKEEHKTLFKKRNVWTLDQHRKKVIDWLPRNIETN